MYFFLNKFWCCNPLFYVHTLHRVTSITLTSALIKKKQTKQKKKNFYFTWKKKNIYQFVACYVYLILYNEGHFPIMMKIHCGRHFSNKCNMFSTFCNSKICIKRVSKYIFWCRPCLLLMILRRLYNLNKSHHSANIID